LILEFTVKFRTIAAIRRIKIFLYDTNRHGQTRRTIITVKEIYKMGRGDKRTRKGKIFAGSFGKTRPQGKKKNTAAAATESKPENKE